MKRGVAAVILLALATSHASSAAAAPSPGARPEGPSFACAHVTSRVNRLICASPELSSLDRDLAETFRAVVNQPTVDAAQLRADEAHWVRRVLQSCVDGPCIRLAFDARISTLRRISLAAASPAARDEMQPFPAPPAVVAASRALIGRSCDGMDNLAALDRSGAHPLGDFVAAPGQTPVILPSATVFVLRSGGVSEAVLFSRPEAAGGRCTITDVAVLPDHGSLLMSCSVDPSKSGGIGSTGVGVRLSDRRLVYWEISAADGRLRRQPLEVLGWTKSVRCQQPEAGE